MSFQSPGSEMWWRALNLACGPRPATGKPRKHLTRLHSGCVSLGLQAPFPQSTEMVCGGSSLVFEGTSLRYLVAVTGIWVRYSADGGPNLASSVLLDAGEGTLAQLAECCDEASPLAPGVLYSSLGEVSKGVHGKAAEVLIVAAFRHSRA